MKTTKKANGKHDIIRYRLIRQSFIMRGRTLVSVARELGVSPSLVTMVARGQRRCETVQNALAAVVGMEGKELWM